MATLSVTLPVGSHSIVASYGGADDFATSTSAPLSYTVDQIATTTTLTASPNPGTTGTQTTFTAVITAASGSVKPTGTVTFTDGSTVIGTADVDPGTATVTVVLATGSHTITASYGGTTDFAPSASTALSYTVAAARTSSAASITTAQETLANTGVSVGPQLGIGLVAILLGSLAMFFGRRRKSHQRS